MNAPSEFLQQVLGAVQRRPCGVRVDPVGRVDAETLAELVAELAAEPDEIVTALHGLRALDVLLEWDVAFDGIEPSFWWAVHPQCVR